MRFGFGFGIAGCGDSTVYDADALTYFAAVVTAGDSISVRSKRAVNTLFLGLKSASLFTKIRRLNPRASNGLAGCAVIAAGSDGAATDTLTGFVAADYSPSLGLKGGTNKYANTGVIPNSLTNKTSLALFAYQCTTPTSPIGYGVGLMSVFGHDGSICSIVMYDASAPAGTIEAQISGVGGLASYIANPRAYSGLFAVDLNGTEAMPYVAGCAAKPTITVSDISSLPIYALCTHARNLLDASRDWWNDGRMGLYAITEHLTAAQHLTLYGLIQTFETAMGRAYISGVNDFDLWGDSILSSLSGPWSSTYFPSGRLVRSMSIGGQTSTQIATRMLADPSGKDRINVIWVGANNIGDPTTILSDIADMVATLGSNEKFIVASPLIGENPTYYDGTAGRIAADDMYDTLASTYPNNYLDVLTDLINEYDSGTPQDVIDYGHRIVPSTLRADNIHLNGTGEGFALAAFTNFITAKGW